jgi:endonuclease
VPPRSETRVGNKITFCLSKIWRRCRGHGIAAPARRRNCKDGVEQLSRYLDLMRRDTLLGTVHGILAAQLIRPQARVLADDRGISCVTVDYDLLRGLDRADDRLF